MRNFTLFELASEITEIVEDIVDAELEGETPEGLYDELDTLYQAREEKHESYVHVIKNAEAVAEACRAEAKQFSQRASALTNLAKRLKNGLHEDLVETGEKSVDAGRFKIARQRGAPRVVVLVDPAELPDDFQRVIIDADKTALKNALKAGETVDGVKLEETEHVRIRVK